MINLMRRNQMIVLLGCLLGGWAPGQDRELDAFAVMEEVTAISRSELWPGFDPLVIPAAIFDGTHTYLFHFADSRANVRPAPSRAGVFVYVGQHPAAASTGVARIEGNWVEKTGNGEKTFLSPSSPGGQSGQ